MQTNTSMTLDDIRSPRDFWHWTSGALVPDVYKKNKYNDDPMQPFEKNYLATYNRVIGGIFMLQHRGVRYNADACPLAYKRFYPVCYTAEEDTLDFGPLYDSDKETTFDVNEALLVNAGVAAGSGADICLTFDTTFLKESLCVEACVKENGEPVLAGSYKTSNSQCSTCRSMCLTHVDGSLRDSENAIIPERLELLCSSCRVYVSNVAGYEGMRLNFFDDADNICERNKAHCLELLCSECIDPGPPAVYASPETTTLLLAGKCSSAAPMCDRYMHNYTHQICAQQYSTCPPNLIADGECNAGCDSHACGHDSGDCCETHVPECTAAMVGDGACNEVCNNDFCESDLSDCDFCTLNTTASFGDCYPQWIGDGRCTKQCYTASCRFDDSDCADCPAACIATLDDGECNQECFDLCPSEADDCPLCSNNCPLFHVGDGTCNKVRHAHRSRPTD